jgi:hypothetical protein
VVDLLEKIGIILNNGLAVSIWIIISFVIYLIIRRGKPGSLGWGVTREAQKRNLGQIIALILAAIMSYLIIFIFAGIWILLTS